LTFQQLRRPAQIPRSASEFFGSVWKIGNERIEKGDGRLTRIVELMHACRMSIHDLSRIGRPARFNMPFELGLACSLKVANPAAYEVFVLDSRP
jgi:hypothetical protein